LQGKDPEPYRVQQVEILPVLPVVREHRFHALHCACCGASTCAWDEDVIGGSRYGERVVATVGILSGQYRQSHRMVQGLLGELLGETFTGIIGSDRFSAYQYLSLASRQVCWAFEPRFDLDCRTQGRGGRWSI